MPASGQEFRVFFDAPKAVVAGSTYTIRVYAEASDIPVDPIAGGGFNFFWMSMIATSGAQGVASVSEADIPILNGATDTGEPDGADLLGIYGLQLNNVIGDINPDWSEDNPILLFTFDVTAAAGFLGDVIYAPEPIPGEPMLCFYPSEYSGATVCSDDPGVGLTLETVTTRVSRRPRRASWACSPSRPGGGADGLGAGDRGPRPPGAQGERVP